ncbi:hypothetical protein D3C80_2086820 [compost metagenome]
MVTGLPSIRKVLARERSARVNQWQRYTSIAGITAASTTPSRKRMPISMYTLLIMPVRVARPPQRIRLTKISFFTLRFSA